AEQPSGTGPFRVTKFVPRERLELEAYRSYWDVKRRPKIDRLVLLPMPEPTTRLAALRSGQVDWIEVPPPDSIPQLKGGGFSITLNSYPHNWTHTLRLDKEPWSNKLVRKAANYAVDRVGICKSLLNDTCLPATGVVYKGHPWFGKPKETYDYNPAKARELLRQAGFDGVSKRPARAVHLISTSGSGQILARLHELIVDDAPWIFVVHDQNPRALSARVKGFVPPQSWFVDLTSVTVR